MNLGNISENIENFYKIPVIGEDGTFDIDEEITNNLKKMHDGLIKEISVVREKLQKSFLEEDFTKCKSIVNNIVSMALLECTSLESLLNKQNGILSTTQFKIYNEWASIILEICAYKQSVENEKILRAIFEKISHIMYKENSNNKMTELFQQYIFGNKMDENENWIIPKPEVCFDDFVGRQNIIKDLKNTILLIPTNAKYTFILFTGPPGVGKSELAKSCMNFFGSEKNYILNLTELSAPIIGQTEEGIKKLFANAVSSSQKISIFFDEADELFKTNVPPHLRSVALSVQTQLAGAAYIGNNVLIIAATNYQNAISPTMRDRMSNIIFIDIPDNFEIIAFFKKKCGIFENNSNDEIEKIVQALNTEYMETLNKIIELPGKKTFRNLENLFREAKDKCILRNMVNDNEIICYVTKNKEYIIHFDKNDINRLLEVSRKGVKKMEDNNLTNLKVNTIEEFKNLEENFCTIHISLINELRKKGINIYYRPTIEDISSVHKNIGFITDDDYEHFLKANNQIKNSTTLDEDDL